MSCRGRLPRPYRHDYKIKDDQAARPISTGKLKALLPVHTRPINLVVYKGSLDPLARMGNLVLGSVSRLDAFSVYRIRT